jgi:CRISPR-associated endonuclease Cas3-HD
VISFAEAYRAATGRSAPAADGTAPRRFIYALPQGSAVAPVVAEARGWLDELAIAGKVALHVAMGSWALSYGLDWREDPHRPAIVIGTSEVLVSKALNRAFGAGPAMWPVDFALVTNGAHWVFPDPGACPRAVATLLRISGLADEYGTAEPLRLTLMSSTGLSLDMNGNAGSVARDDGAVDVDLLRLFDTSPEAAGSWPDVAPLVSEAGRELAVGVARATWTPGDGGAPDPEVRAPGAEYRAPVPLSAVAELAAGHAVWRRAEDGAWARVSAAADVRPFEVLLVRAGDGEAAPLLRTIAEEAALAAEAGVSAETPARPWQSLDEHSAQVRDQAAALVSVLGPAVPDAARKSAVVAGYLHDVGKAHQIWQDALCALAPDADQAAVQSGRPWAKSGSGAQGRLEFAHGGPFRHELASLLLVDAPLRSLLAAAPDPDLCRYLILAHHGQLRTRVSDREPAGPGEGKRVILGLEQGAVCGVPPILGQPATTLTVDLAQFGEEDGGRWFPAVWSQAVARLLEKYGPFRLAYLETLVRMADWRASGGRELPRPSLARQDVRNGTRSQVSTGLP